MFKVPDSPSAMFKAMQRMCYEQQQQEKANRKAYLMERLLEKAQEEPDGIWQEMYDEFDALAASGKHYA